MKKVCAAILFMNITLFGFSQNRVGINTNSPLELLDVNGHTNLRGALKINGNAGTTGQVLVSQGNNTPPVWMNNVVDGGGRFWLTFPNNTHNSGRFGFNISGSTTQEDSLDFTSVKIYGTDFTLSTAGEENNYITVNRSGLYHFEGTIRIFATSEPAISMAPRGIVRFLANEPSGVDPNIILVEERLEEESSTISGGNDFHNLNAKFQINVYLLAGATVAFRAGLTRLKTSTPLVGLGIASGGYIAGHFIAE